MAWVAVATAAVGVVGSAVVSGSQSSAAQSASDSQSAAAQAQIDESRRQFDAIQKLLQPYVDVGTPALVGQKDIIGLNGTKAQQTAINNLSTSPLYQSLAQQGENAILQNASATGGLRGGNTQGALAQFRPQLLNQLINQQYDRLGGLTTLGQNSAAGVGAAGQTSSAQIINALDHQGAAQAGNAIAQGNATSGLVNGLTQAAGAAFGSGSGAGGYSLFGNNTSTAALPANYNPSGTSFGGETFSSGGFQNNGFAGGAF